MGVYVYRVTNKLHKCSDGQMANIAHFAYKPWGGWDGEKANARMHFRSGATASDRLADTGKLKTGRLVMALVSEDHDTGTTTVEVYKDGAVYENVSMIGTFYDSSIGGKNIPVIPGVTA